MSSPRDFEPGNYRFLGEEGPFSEGIAPAAGFALRRVRFARPVPMAAGFAAIKEHLVQQGRPLTALAACELRSPKPMTPQEFATFNALYLTTLHAWGCRLDAFNPVARSNLAPALEAPSEAMFFAFTYTVPEAGAAGDFLISGFPEIRAGVPAAERVVGGDDVSTRGLEAKTRFVLDELRRRIRLLGGDWSAITGAQVYTVHELRPLLESVFAPAGLSQIGLAWYPAWPPVIGFHVEVDVRRVRVELVL